MALKRVFILDVYQTETFQSSLSEQGWQEICIYHREVFFFYSVKNERMKPQQVSAFRWISDSDHLKETLWNFGNNGAFS